jgi:hypothetical protein
VVAEGGLLLVDGRSWAGIAAHVAGQAIENSDGGLLRDASNAGSGLACSRPCVLLVQAGRRWFSRRLLEAGQTVIHRNRFVVLAPLAGFGTGEFFLYGIYQGGEPFPDERRVSCLRTIASTGSALSYSLLPLVSFIETRNGVALEPEVLVAPVDPIPALPLAEATFDFG